jgi:sirohydrochlorin ferrochelatase
VEYSGWEFAKLLTRINTERQIWRPFAMKAVLYICHGSRIKEAQQEAIAFIEACRQDNPHVIQEYGFLELAEPAIETAFKKCVEKGAKQIIAIPVLLLAAGHVKEDIPLELAKLQKRFPEIDIRLGQPFGVHPAMGEILIERINETNQEITADSMVLLAGRGSSDPQVKVDLGKIANSLHERLKIRVNTCFLTGTEPSLQEGLKIARESGCKKIFILPYLLFTGFLMQKIEKMIKVNGMSQNQQIILCNYLGYHPILKQILKERIQEA